MVQHKKWIIFNIVFVALALLITGCAKELDNQEVEKINSNMNVVEGRDGSENDEKPMAEKPIMVLDFSNIKGWAIFKEESFNFTFSYPDVWRYELRQYSSNSNYEYVLIKAEFYDQNDDLVLVISNSNPEVGYETYTRLNHGVVNTNDEDTDLLLGYYILDNEISGIEGDFNMILLEWHKGKKCNNPETDCLLGQLTGSTDSSGNMIMVNYPRINNDYYKLIADKISKTFSFINQ